MLEKSQAENKFGNQGHHFPGFLHAQYSRNGSQSAAKIPEVQHPDVDLQRTPIPLQVKQLQLLAKEKELKIGFLIVLGH